MNKNRLKSITAIITGIIILTACKTYYPDGENSDKEDTQETIENIEIPKLTAGQTSQIIEHYAYTVSYNDDWKLPNWVAYEMDRSKTTGEVGRCSHFYPDPDVKGKPVEHSDYTNNPGKYDRGHMAPAADMKWSEKAMKECFYMTNVCPQNANLNRGDWNDIEEFVRDIAEKYDTIYIVCGPIVADNCNYMGNNQRIAIPDAYYKALLRKEKGEWRTIGFICENKAGSQPIMTYLRSIDEIEKAAGIDLFSNLPDDVEERIEKDVDMRGWTLGKENIGELTEEIDKIDAVNEIKKAIEDSELKEKLKKGVNILESSDEIKDAIDKVTEVTEEVNNLETVKGIKKAVSKENVKKDLKKIIKKINSII